MKKLTDGKTVMFVNGNSSFVKPLPKGKDDDAKAEKKAMLAGAEKVDGYPTSDPDAALAGYKETTEDGVTKIHVDRNTTIVRSELTEVEKRADAEAEASRNADTQTNTG